MRTHTLAFLALGCMAATVAACDDSTNNTPPDMTATAGDMAMPATDGGGGDGGGGDAAPAPDMTKVTDVSCFGKVTPPTPAKSSYDFKVQLVDFQSKAPVAGATVKVCPEADATCASPSSMGTTDSSGIVSLSGPSAAFGLGAYIDATATGYIEGLTYARGLGTGDALATGQVTIPVLAFSTNTATLVYGILGVTPDPTKGLVAFSADDCKMQSLAGVTATVANADSGTKTFYVAGNFPSNTATATDAGGSGLITGVPPGTTEIDATYANAVYSKVPIVVRAGQITAAGAFPTM